MSIDGGQSGSAFKSPRIHPTESKIDKLPALKFLELRDSPGITLRKFLPKQLWVQRGRHRYRRGGFHDP